MDHEKLDRRWEEFVTSGEPTIALAEIDGLLQHATSTDRAFLLLARSGIAQGRRPSFDIADDLAEAVRLIAEHSDSDFIAGRAHTVAATMHMNNGDFAAAEPLFSLAFDAFESLGLKWHLSGVLNNWAINCIQIGQGTTALQLLDKAKECLTDVEVPMFMSRQRQIGILINRAGAYASISQVELATSMLLKAVSLADQAEDGLILGSIWLNLAISYSGKRQFGSCLEAASAAVDYLDRAGKTEDLLRAQVLRAQALRQIGRPAEGLGILEPIVASWEDGGGAPPMWLLEAAEELSYLYRSQGEFDQAAKTELYFADLTSRTNNLSDGNLLNRLHALIQVLLTGTPGSAAEKTIENEIEVAAETLRNGSAPWTPVIADLLVGLLVAFRTGELSPALQQRVGDLKTFDHVPDEMITWFEQTLIAMAAMGKGEKTGLLASDLIDLYRRQTEARSLEDEVYRASYLVATPELSRVLDMAAQMADGALVMELIEFARTDLAASTTRLEGAVLPPFRELRPDATREVQNGPFFLGKPAALSVRGFSYVGRAAAKEPTIELETLRQAWGGPESAWLSLFVVDKTLFWSFSTGAQCAGGAVTLDERFKKALRSHQRMLVQTTEEDLEIGDDSPPWVREVLGIARAAASELMMNDALIEECLGALPPKLRDPVNRYVSQVAAISLEAVHSTLADYIIPGIVRDYVQRNPDHSLIISTAPELATIPFGLLPIHGTRLMIEQTSILLMPPVAVAVASLSVPGGRGPHLLEVRNAASDLSYSTGDRHSQAGVILTGWAGAAHQVRVATPQNIVETLARLPARGLFSYVGHIRPGVKGRPGSAGFVLSPLEPWEKPHVLSSTELMALGARFPSRLYLGGCEGSGFGTGLEWASIAGVALSRGSSCVVAHSWPIIDHPAARTVDQACIDTLVLRNDPVEGVRDMQLEKLEGWRAGDRDSAPHWWAGLQIIGRKDTH